MKRSPTLFLASSFILCSHLLEAQCTAVGPSDPATASLNTSVGSFGWANPTDVLTSDNNRAVAGALIGILASANTNYVAAQGFTFTVPVSATICGIQVDVEHSAGGLLIGSSIKDNSVKIMKSGSVIGTEHASGNSWFGSDEVVSYGGSGDTWGTTWTPSDFNTSNVGVAVSARLSAGLAALFLNAQIDHIQMTVFYTLPLPVELVYFDVTENDNDKITLSWATSTEVNNAYFTLESSADAVNWQPVAEVNGAGNSNVLTNYQYELTHEMAGTVYFKLSQYNNDGSREELAVREIDIQSNPVAVHYLPANQDLAIQFSAADEDAEIAIYNLHGACVQKLTKEKGQSIVHLSTSGMSGQMYVVTIIGASVQYTRKFMF